VLDRISEALGGTASVAGVPLGPSMETLAPNSPLPQEMERANAAKNRHVRDLMSQPSVIGVGVGSSEDNLAEGAIVVYVDRTAGRMPALPERVDNVRVRVVFTDPFVAY
ncbi:MAG TPA: hypothetical protein VG324_03900, partial [Blastocatellia bacterium]|nr:hypothetical protein [Blastocatellia bacterium]